MRACHGIAVLLGLMSMVASSALELARPFGNHMVLPQGTSVPIWGGAAPDAPVEVRFGKQVVSTRSDAKGQWRVNLAAGPAMASGRDLVVTTAEARVVLTDVLVGEVWLCAGQSNMDFPLAGATGGKADAATAGELPAIRLCHWTGLPTDRRVYQKSELARLAVAHHFTGGWMVAGPQNVLAFSAIGWWVAKAIHQQRGVPVGVIDMSVGGSGAEAWLPVETLQARPEYQMLLGDRWVECDKIGAWARGRAKFNLGNHQGAIHPFKPGFLFDSGVRPWTGFPLAGVLWYQGETNAELNDPPWNQRLIEDLITGWRSSLQLPRLPFYMVQLPRIGGHDPLRQFWPEFRQCQSRATRRLPQVHLIRTDDLGWDSPDVHQPDKLPIAKRLADAILRP